MFDDRKWHHYSVETVVNKFFLCVYVDHLLSLLSVYPLCSPIFCSVNDMSYHISNYPRESFFGKFLFRIFQFFFFINFVARIFHRVFFKIKIIFICGDAAQAYYATIQPCFFQSQKQRSYYYSAQRRNTVRDCTGLIWYVRYCIVSWNKPL